MGIHCKKCKEDIMDPIEDSWEAWTRLSNYFQIKYLSGEITKKLYHALVDDLMYLQPIGDLDGMDGIDDLNGSGGFDVNENEGI